jgi:hypothetical protein
MAQLFRTECVHNGVRLQLAEAHLRQLQPVVMFM